MSVIVRGMEMPKCCEECIFSIHDPTGGSSACAKMHQIILRKMNESRPRWCPLEEVQEDDGK